MTDRQTRESNKRRAKYEDLINLMVQGRTVSEALDIANLKHIKVSRNTLLRLKKEYVDNISRY